MCDSGLLLCWSHFLFPKQSLLLLFYISVPFLTSWAVKTIADTYMDDGLVSKSRMSKSDNFCATYFLPKSSRLSFKLQFRLGKS